MEHYLVNGTITKYPHSSIEIMPGDVLYSSIGRSTYYVGHAVIVGTDGMCKEALPEKPAGHELTIIQFWGRHRLGDRILLMRAKAGGEEAADWTTKYSVEVEHYNHLINDFTNVAQNYCFKFIAQAYYYGAEQSILKRTNQVITPFKFKREAQLEKIALFQIE